MKHFIFSFFTILFLSHPTWAEGTQVLSCDGDAIKYLDVIKSENSFSLEYVARYGADEESSVTHLEVLGLQTTATKLELNAFSMKFPNVKIEFELDKAKKSQDYLNRTVYDSTLTFRGEKAVGTHLMKCQLNVSK